MSTFRPMRKAGSLRTGYQGDMGSIIHAVPPDHTHDGQALCGQVPAIQWSECDGHEVTCPRCRRAMEQPDMFDRPPPARRKPRRLMHVVDYGSGRAWFACRRCGYESGWLQAGRLSDDKRGRPCPRCNPTEGGAS